MSQNIKIISIEGNIGSGKSTLLKSLKEEFASIKNVIFLKEPVDEWEKIKDANGLTMLQKFYSNQEKYSFAFQMMAYISRLKIIRDTIKNYYDNTDNKLTELIIITERSLYTDKYVFAKMLYDQRKIEDVGYQIYSNWFDEFAKEYPVSHIIYVNTEPKICYDRIHIRARPGEEVIPLEYLTDCHNYHEEFISEFHVNKVILDGNQNIFENHDILKTWIQQIYLLIK
jgi:deoxyadenosine/deoxycytidine kinase